MTEISLFDKRHASLSRDTGAGILEMIASATEDKPVPIINDFDFVDDGVMCEWAWVVDLDNEVLEMFYNQCKNFVGRFGGQDGDKLGLLKSFSFEQLNDTEVEEFFYDFKGPYWGDGEDEFGSHLPHDGCEGGSN